VRAVHSPSVSLWQAEINGGLMPNILIAEGTPALWQTEHAGFAIPSNFSLFAAAVQLHDPGIRCTLINIADGGALPFGGAVGLRRCDDPGLAAPYL
jgi:hypothetical protein